MHAYIHTPLIRQKIQVGKKRMLACGPGIKHSKGVKDAKQRVTLQPSNSLMKHVTEFFYYQ